MFPSGMALLLNVCELNVLTYDLHKKKKKYMKPPYHLQILGFAAINDNDYKKKFQTK